MFDQGLNSPKGYVLQLHGGGFRIGRPEFESLFAEALANRCHVEVVVPQYRLAPEGPFPAGLIDAFEALKALRLGLNVMVFSDNVPSNTTAKSAAYGAAQDIKITLPSATSYATFAADTDPGQLGGGAISVNLPALILTPGQTFTICFRATIG